MEQTVLVEDLISLHNFTTVLLSGLFFMTLGAYRIYRQSNNKKESNLTSFYSYVLIGIIIGIFILLCEFSLLIKSENARIVLISNGILAICSIFFALKTRQ